MQGKNIARRRGTTIAAAALSVALVAPAVHPVANAEETPAASPAAAADPADTGTDTGAAEPAGTGADDGAANGDADK